jgi:histidine triad (HIT) family protein
LLSYLLPGTETDGGKMADCIFCKIIAGEIPSTQVYNDDLVTAFRDINPAAPTHVLIIPNRHIASVNDLTSDDEPLMGYLFTVAKQIAAQEGIAESGYRLIVNTGPDGGQEVFHIHLHLLGGQRMRHPMG